MKQTVQVEVDTTKVEQEAYKKGLDEAWDLATQLIRKTCPNDLKKMGFFDHAVEHEHISALLNKFTASEALAKLRDYEARKKAEDEAVKVGDEVVLSGDTWRYVVIYIEQNIVMIMGRCGAFRIGCDEVTKTGRHFPEIAAVLGQMKGE